MGVLDNAEQFWHSMIDLNIRPLIVLPDGNIENNNFNDLINLILGKFPGVIPPLIAVLLSRIVNQQAPASVSG